MYFIIWMASINYYTSWNYDDTSSGDGFRFLWRIIVAHIRRDIDDLQPCSCVSFYTIKMYNVVGNIFAYCMWIGGIARQPEEFNQPVHEARALYIAEHSVARRRSIFRLYTLTRTHIIYIYIYNVCVCVCIILIHSNRRSGHHCVRKSNLFHIYTRLKPPLRTEFDDIGRRILYTRPYIILSPRSMKTRDVNESCLLYSIRSTPAHKSLVCV